jgi:D-serine deaminase-like pyridoxal phosphate-dependent protein
MTKSNWYELDDPAAVESPGLVFYEDRIRENIKTLIGMIDDKSRLRPHVKTHKSAEVTKLMLQAGLKKFKCATIAEAEMLGSCEAPDVLLAYQPVGPNIQRFMVLQKRFPATQFSCITDNLGAAKNIAAAAAENDLHVLIYIDVNVGMNRTGILPKNVLALYEALLGVEKLEVLGLHAYDGHIHEPDFGFRQQEVTKIIKQLEWLRQQIESKYQKQPVIIAGGTPGFPIYAGSSDFECSAGTFALWDFGYQQSFPEQNFITAALVITRVVSLPAANLICTDLGHKAVAAENILSNRITFLNAPGLVAISQSEEHLVLDAGTNHGYKIGDVLYGLPIHICPTVALYDYAYSVSSERSPQLWPIRSRKRRDTI